MPRVSGGMEIKMRKQLVVCMIISLIFILTGCQTYVTKTFNMNNGDEIEVKLETTEGIQLKAHVENGSELESGNVQFSITGNEDELLTVGGFGDATYLAELRDSVSMSEDVTIISESEEENANYIFYKIGEESEEEWIYIIILSDSSTGIVISNNISQESATKIFESLSFDINLE